MSRFLARIRGLFKSRTQVGIDKAGNQYFIRNEEVDGIMKERRWVIFRGEEDPTSLPVEWICWLNGQRKKPPTPEEMMELEARRERVKLNIAKLQKEEEEEKLKRGVPQPSKTGKVGPPDLESFIKQFPGASLDPGSGEVPDLESDSKEKWTRKFRDSDSTNTKTPAPKAPRVPMSTEPTGSGESFKPGTWQPPS
ncbi:uncharacterized protein LOC116246286 isoform X2 [Nymphaea colorata]|uniref:uncharacterized protein LOC116246286 isoform X2 n=1 Tax=Nymphaea colorata TaxID=210225 RepID=UPI00129D5D66|nr:uncharacterized protein LOC116246286 isoform X2 [Nymphaea colorata]